VKTNVWVREPKLVSKSSSESTSERFPDRVSPL
jgi:hypothetical protein